MNQNTALLLIDVQVNMFETGHAIHNAAQILDHLKDLLQKARAANIPIIFIQNNGSDEDPDKPNSEGWQILSDVKPLASEPVIQKFTMNSFKDTSLATELKTRQIQNLVIAGMQTDYCVQTTCRAASELGYTVTLVQDAHSTYDSSESKASEIITHYNDQLANSATLKTTAQITFNQD